MLSIPLSAAYKCLNSGRFTALVDDVDSDLAVLSWCAKVQRRGVNLLVYGQCETQSADGLNLNVLMRRLIAERMFGPLPNGFEVDHIEHGKYGGLDNRRANLRLAKHSLNVANGRIRANNTSGFKGVHWVGRINKWQALIRVNGKRHHLGYFVTASEAGAAYDTAALSAWGEFARTNGALA